MSPKKDQNKNKRNLSGLDDETRIEIDRLLASYREIQATENEKKKWRTAIREELRNPSVESYPAWGERLKKIIERFSNSFSLHYLKPALVFCAGAVAGILIYSVQQDDRPRGFKQRSSESIQVEDLGRDYVRYELDPKE